MPATSFTDEIAEYICEQLMEGWSMVKICEQSDMPSRATVIRWMEQFPAFATRCARAREMQGDLMDDKILDIANASTPETAAADRVKISAYQWRAAKLQPKKYGDKLAIGGADDLPPVQTQNTIDVSGASLEELEALKSLLTRKSDG